MKEEKICPDCIGQGEHWFPGTASMDFIDGWYTCEMCDGTGKILLNQAKHETAKEKPNPRIVIDVTGGIVQGVWADIPIDVRIIDGDENPPDPGRVINIAEEHAPPEYVYAWESIPCGTENKEMVDRIFERTAGLF